MEKQLYTVKEVAKLLHLSEHAIRYYSDRGLIPSLQRDRNNNRIFDQEAINWLTGVKYLKECGMTLEAIKTYIDLCLIGDATVEKRYEVLHDQKERAEIQLEEAQIRLDFINHKLEHYQEIIDHKINDDTNPSKW